MAREWKSPLEWVSTWIFILSSSFQPFLTVQSIQHSLTDFLLWLNMSLLSDRQWIAIFYRLAVGSKAAWLLPVNQWSDMASKFEQNRRMTIDIYLQGSNALYTCRHVIYSLFCIALPPLTGSLYEIWGFRRCENAYVGPQSICLHVHAALLPTRSTSESLPPWELQSIDRWVYWRRGNSGLPSGQTEM